MAHYAAVGKPGRTIVARLRPVTDLLDGLKELANEHGIKAAYMQCHFTPDYHRNYVFIGTEGRVENSEPDGKVWVKTRNRRHDWRSLSDRTYHVKPAEGTHGGADPVIAQDFLDMVIDGKEPLAIAVAVPGDEDPGGAEVASRRTPGSRDVEPP